MTLNFSLIHQGQAVAIIRSVAESIENVEKVLILAQDIQQPAVELRSLEILRQKLWKEPGIFWEAEVFRPSKRLLNDDPEDVRFTLPT